MYFVVFESPNFVVVILNWFLVKFSTYLLKIYKPLLSSVKVYYVLSFFFNLVFNLSLDLLILLCYILLNILRLFREEFLFKYLDLRI